MAKKILINKKTGIEFQTSDPDTVLKKHPRVFKVKPGTTLAKDIEVKEESLVKTAPVETTTEVKPKEKSKKIVPTSSDKKD